MVLIQTSRNAQKIFRMVKGILWSTLSEDQIINIKKISIFILQRLKDFVLFVYCVKYIFSWN